jgi:hypothetical protein
MQITHDSNLQNTENDRDSEDWCWRDNQYTSKQNHYSMPQTKIVKDLQTPYYSQNISQKNASENRLLLNRPKNTEAIIVPRNGLFWNNQRNATASRSESTECGQPWDPLGYGKKEELKQSKEKGLSQIWRGNGVDATEEKKVLMVRTFPATLVGKTLSFTSLPDRFRKRRNETKREITTRVQTKRETRFLKRHKKSGYKEGLRSEIFFRQCRYLSSQANVAQLHRLEHSRSIYRSSHHRQKLAGGVFRSSAKKTPPSEP